MKRMLKKLAAIALAGAMVMSLSVTALAAEETVSGMGTQGTASGTVESQGKIPDDVINVRMPLTAAEKFNMYVDPHNLIRESGNAMEIGGSGTAAELFSTDTLLYFANKTEDGTLTGFSKTSDPIKVTNMSNVPVNIDMKATWTMGTGNTYDLAKDAADLAAAKADGKASMYLTLDDTFGNSDAVVNKDKGVPQLTYTPAKTSTGDALATGTGDTNYLAKYIKSVDFAFTSDANEDDIRLLNEGGYIYASNGTEGAHKTPADWMITFTKVDKKTPTVAFDAGQLPTYPTLTGSGSNVSLKKDNVYKVTYTEGTTSASTNNIAITDTLDINGDHTYTVPNGEAKTKINIVRGTTTPIVATITIEWDYEAIGANGYNVTQDVKSGDATQDTYAIGGTGFTTKVLIAESGEGAYLSNDVNYTEGSYKLAKNSAGTALEWKLNEEGGFTAEAVDNFQSVSFTLTGAITDGDTCAAAWDDAFDADSPSTVELVWSVNKCDAVDPSVTVTSALESATGTAEAKIDWGYGDKKASAITAASVTTAAGATQEFPIANVAVDGSNLTITSTNLLFSENGGNGVITLTFSLVGGGTKDVKVDLTKAVASS